MYEQSHRGDTHLPLRPAASITTPSQVPAEYIGGGGGGGGGEETFFPLS